MSAQPDEHDQDVYADTTRQIIDEEYRAGRMDPVRYEALMARADELEDARQQELDALYAQYDDSSAMSDLRIREVRQDYAAKKRSLEFDVMGVDLKGLIADYDHLRQNLNTPDHESRRSQNAAKWRSLSPEQKERVKERIVDDGVCSMDELEDFIHDQWEWQRR